MAGVIGAAAFSGSSLGQNITVQEPDRPTSGPVPEWARRMAIDPESPASRAYAAQQKQRIEAERELKKIRHKHFGVVKVTEIRQAGIAKLREYTDPAIYPSLVSIFKDEGLDVRTALLDHFADRHTEEGDAAMAWMAVYDKDTGIQAAARDRLLSRRSESGQNSRLVKLVVYGALQSENEHAIAGAADLAAGLSMTDAIPWLIAAQVGGGGAGAGSGEADRDGDLGWIVVGKQVAFVSDLTPVVSESAVGFDPQLSTITEGVLLRVHDAVVITYRTEVHNSLVGLSSASWGQPTKGLGWDQKAWENWYRREYVPCITDLAARTEADKRKETSDTPDQPK
jgi:hypothetical protein